MAAAISGDVRTSGCFSGVYDGQMRTLTGVQAGDGTGDISPGSGQKVQSVQQVLDRLRFAGHLQTDHSADRPGELNRGRELGSPSGTG